MKVFSLFLLTTTFLSLSAQNKETCERFLKPQIKSSLSCRKCHEEEYKAWEGSRHKVSFSNSLFQRGYKQEKDARCLTCHIPMLEQQDIFFSGDTNNLLLQEGVNCQSCHAPVLNNVHLLKESIFCARCHQFTFRNSNEYAQKTFNEWNEYKNSGGTKTCQKCHMPNGIHSFEGIYTFSHLKTSLNIAIVQVNGDNKKLSIENKIAGHHVPTGDVYRHITVEAKESGSSDFKVIATIGRNPFWKNTSTGQSLVFKNDNALKSGEMRLYDLPERTKEVRVVYHFEANWAGRYYWNGEHLEKKIIFDSVISYSK